MELRRRRWRRRRRRRDRLSSPEWLPSQRTRIVCKTLYKQLTFSLFFVFFYLLSKLHVAVVGALCGVMCRCHFLFLSVLSSVAFSVSEREMLGWSVEHLRRNRHVLNVLG